MSANQHNPQQQDFIAEDSQKQLLCQMKQLEKALEYQKNFKNELLIYLESEKLCLQNQMKHLSDLTMRHKESEKKMLFLANKLEQTKTKNQEYEDGIKKQKQSHFQPLRSAKNKVQKLKQSKQKIIIQLKTLQKETQQLDQHIKLMTQKNQSIHKNNKTIQKKVLKTQQETKKINQNIQELYLVKKKLNNELQEMRGNIRVYCRIRPFIHGQDGYPIHQLINQNTLKLKVPKQNQRSQKHQKDLLYNFQQIFDMHESQNNVFDELAQLIQSAIDGKNVCIFTYGQTGSGKTFTMQGGDDPQTKGIIPRSVQLIFQEIEKAKQYQWKYSLSISIQQVYLEAVRDLLEVKNSNNQENSEKILVNSPEQIYVLLQQAMKNRKVAETNCNQHSSRSHLIFTLYLEAFHTEKKIQRIGSLNLVDLAGSQRVGLSKVQGERMKETQAINKSLTQLGVVIMAMGRKQGYVPFRNSKLTHLLQKYLQGDSKTLMFVNISPKQSDYHQTLCSLRFAEQVKQCKIKK